MKKLLLCVGLFTIHGFIEAAAHDQRLIIWRVGVSGAVYHPDFPRFVFGKEVSVNKFYPNLPLGACVAPLIVNFDHLAQSDDKSKLEALRPAANKPVTQVAVKLPAGYAGWDKLPDDAAIVLRYSATTKVAASLELSTAEISSQMLPLVVDPAPTAKWCRASLLWKVG